MPEPDSIHLKRRKKLRDFRQHIAVEISAEQLHGMRFLRYGVPFMRSFGSNEHDVTRVQGKHSAGTEIKTQASLRHNGQLPDGMTMEPFQIRSEITVRLVPYKRIR